MSTAHVSFCVDMYEDVLMCTLSIYGGLLSCPWPQTSYG
jgi:hypothetical protein